MIATQPALEQKMLDLFFARTDTFVTHWAGEDGKSGYTRVCAEHPTWIMGRCRVKAENPKCSKCEHFRPLPMTDKIMRLHLNGAITVGAYQIGEDGTNVKWACLDFDDHGLASEQELQTAALLARESLLELQLPAYFEASGGNGWRCHLWVFFGAPVPAIKAKVLLDAALRQAGLSEKPFIERFPKQTRALNGYGNLVKVPLGVHRKTKRRSQFLNLNLEPIGDPQLVLESIEAVDPMTVDLVIDMRALRLEEAAIGLARPVSKFDYPSDKMNQILAKCWYFRELERQQRDPEKSVFYEDWWNYLLMFCRFGDAGGNRILWFSEQDPRYDQDRTINLINYVREHGYHMPSCKRLREGPGLVHCPLDPMECGAA